MAKPSVARLLLVGLTWLPALASAQVPAGGEFRVNTYTTSAQRAPALAMDAQRNFVVVWQSPQDGSSYGVFGQRFDVAATPQGAEFRLNTYTTNVQGGPAVAMDPQGNFVVVWLSVGQDGSNIGVFGQRFDAAATRRGTEFRVNTYTTGNQSYAAVATDPQGNFVVVWNSFGQDGSGYGVFGQRFDAAGTPRGAEFRVNTYTTSGQFTRGVATDPQGNFVVVWNSFGQDGSGYGVFGQRFDAAGTPRGAEFRINTYTTGTQANPTVATDSQGNFVVAWISSGQDGSSNGVFGQRFDAAGLPRGGEFRVNTYTTNMQARSAVATDPQGNFVVVWNSNGQDGSGYGVFGQRFGGLLPAALAVDSTPVVSDGNGVLEPGETVTLAPAWHNVNGAAQTFTGTLATLTGPPGPTYFIVDNLANYGTVANATTGSCTATGDCYTLGISAPPTRPALHWDVSVQEALAPDALGQATTWTLHVGDSFTDVPRANPFYRFVETLLHHSVTSGCSPSQYCPSSSTTREQMAVFVLRAKDPTLTPPPAVGIFSDVPPSSPFAPWIEELFRRGVVTGCGGTNYCPTSPVTREQMAVFVLRTKEPTLTPPACMTPLFSDVPASSPFCRWVEELARRGVVTGCGGGNYCPTSPVTREQMGVFLSVTFGLALYGP